MADIKWVGGAATATQVETFTLNNDFNDSETAVTITMTDENGGTVPVSITPSGVDEDVIAAQLQSALAGSVNALFAAVTWTVASNVVTGTANTTGVPFYAASSVTGGAGTITDNESTSSAGPHDWNTTGNWEGAALPVSTDDVRVTGDVDIRYGLDQNAVALASLSVAKDYTGSIGDSANNYSLQIDATTVTIEGNGAHYLIDGTSTDVYVKRTSSGTGAVVLDGDIGTLHVNGPGVAGEVQVESGAVLDNVYLLSAPRGSVTVASGVTSLDLVEMDGGQFDNSSSLNGTGSSVRVSGGTYTQTDGALPGTAENGLIIQNRGAVKYNTEGTLAKANIHGGTLDFTDSTADSVTVTDVTMRSGAVLIDSGLSNVTFTNPIEIKGGGNVRQDAGKTVTV